jgi:nucleoside-triphosphatase THEP1
MQESKVIIIDVCMNWKLKQFVHEVNSILQWNQQLVASRCRKNW